MNLNTLMRQDVFDLAEHSVVVSSEDFGRGASAHKVVDYVADRIADE